MLPVVLAFCAVPQWPEDARALLQWQAAREQDDALAAPDAAALRDRLYLYTRAGAQAQAWDAAARLEGLSPGDADGERYRVQLCAWEPERWLDGERRAEAWLAAHADRPAGEAASVRAVQEHLQRLLAARAAVQARQRARSWVPWAGGLLWLAGILALARRAP